MNSGMQVFHFLKARNVAVLLATVGVAVGIALGRPMLIQIAVAMVVAIGVSLWQATRTLKSINVKRTHTPRAFQKNTVGVELDLQLAEGAVPELLLVEDEFSPSSPGRMRRLLGLSMQRDAITHIQYFGTCEHRRGLYVLGPVRMQAMDAMGFFPRELILDAFTELLVYPQAVSLQQLALLDEGTIPHVGLETTRRHGVSEEFIGLREYRPGDSPRIVHWPSSARHGRLLVKEFQEERTTLVTLLLDLGRQGLVGVGDQTSVEYGIRCCASIAQRAVDRGHQVALYAIGEKVEHLPPGSGTAHLLTLLDRLALLRTKGESGFAAVVGDVAPLLARGSTAVLIQGATTVDFDKIAGPIRVMLDRRILPVVVLVDDRAFIKLFREQEDRHYQALSLEETARQLRLLGARVHIITRARTIEEALMQGLDVEEAAV